jgi:hypothetical protein
LLKEFICIIQFYLFPFTHFCIMIEGGCLYIIILSLYFQRPSWEKAAKIIRERYSTFFCFSHFLETAVWKFYPFISLINFVTNSASLYWFSVFFCTISFLFRYDPEMDGRIFLGKVDCTQEGDLCRRCLFS